MDIARGTNLLSTQTYATISTRSEKDDGTGRRVLILDGKRFNPSKQLPYEAFKSKLPVAVYRTEGPICLLLPLRAI